MLSRVMSYKQVGADFKYCQLKPIYKQNVKIMIRTWNFVHFTTPSNSFALRIQCKNIDLENLAAKTACMVYVNKQSFLFYYVFIPLVSLTEKDAKR